MKKVTSGLIGGMDVAELTFNAERESDLASYRKIKEGTSEFVYGVDDAKKKGKKSNFVLRMHKILLNNATGLKRSEAEYLTGRTGTQRDTLNNARFVHLSASFRDEFLDLLKANSVEQDDGKRFVSLDAQKIVEDELTVWAKFQVRRHTTQKEKLAVFCNPTPLDYRPEKQINTRHGGEYDAKCLLAVGPQGC